MNYKVDVSDVAKEDLRKIHEYIEFELGSPNAARRISRAIVSQIQALSFMPERYRVYPEEPLFSQKIHFFQVENYQVFYKVSQSEGVVRVGRILYGRRDIPNSDFDSSVF